MKTTLSNSTKFGGVSVSSCSLQLDHQDKKLISHWPYIVRGGADTLAFGDGMAEVIQRFAFQRRGHEYEGREDLLPTNPSTRIRAVVRAISGEVGFKKEKKRGRGKDDESRRRLSISSDNPSGECVVWSSWNVYLDSKPGLF